MKRGTRWGRFEGEGGGFGEELGGEGGLGGIGMGLVRRETEGVCWRSSEELWIGLPWEKTM